MNALLQVFFPLIVLVAFFLNSTQSANAQTKFFQYQSIDTMKYSRDSARAGLTAGFIDAQLTRIAKTGTTHVAIDTPYDEEFYPVLKIWVNEARKLNLHIWFRGNFSGWEGWFDYPKITQIQHIDKLKNFLQKRQDLFETGDIFVSCPECENGGPGDPRQTGLVDNFRNFIISEKNTADKIFSSEGKQIQTGYYSMNGDVARLVMDKTTTKALGGVVTIDHYVATPQKLYDDIKSIAANSGGNIVLGEFGAPIPDINGNLNESQQAEWIKLALEKIYNSPQVIGLNYWVSFGGSTALWNDDNSPKKAVEVITKVYSPSVFAGNVIDQFGAGINNAKIMVYGKIVKTGWDGKFTIPVAYETNLTAVASGFTSAKTTVFSGQTTGYIILKKINPSLFYRIKASLSCIPILCKK